MNNNVGFAISAEGLSKKYDQLVALDDVTFALEDGITALVGVNGAGKSTLLTTLAGALRPGQGRVVVGGNDAYSRRSRKEALRHVALVPQLPQFPKNLRAEEVVAYLAWMRGVPSRECMSRAREALDHVGLTARARTKVGALSGGMQRRVALAQALASRADVLLLDEPSTGLDPQQRRAMVDLLRDLPGTVFISSHVMEDVAELANRVIVLDAGKVRFDGTLDGLRALAPVGTPESRTLEAGFLSVSLGGSA